MKRIIVFSLFSIGIVAAAILLLNPKTATGAYKFETSGPGKDLPDSINTFVQNACIDCHSDDGASLAKSKLNFSKWSTYDAEKQLKKANAMVKELIKNDMPPKKWRSNNPEKVPTQAQIDMITGWAKSLAK